MQPRRPCSCFQRTESRQLDSSLCSVDSAIRCVMSVPTTLDSFFLIFAPVADTRIEEDASCADSTASTTGRASEVRYKRQVNLAGTTYGNQS